MLDKIQFQNGTIATAEFLDEIQKGTNFSSTDQREDYFAEPTAPDQASWKIGQRDRIKDWEIADPRLENQTNIGRLAHDGVVLGWDSVNNVVVTGPASLAPAQGGLGVWVEAGSIIGTNGEPITWSRQLVQLIDSSESEVTYLYIDEDFAKEKIAALEAVTISVGSSLPSVSIPHAPLAKLTLGAGGTTLAVDGDGVVSGTGYVDLRSGVYISNLNTYPKILRNTDIINDSVTASSWERVIVDTSNGSLVVELPADPTDSDRIAVVDIAGTFDRFPLVLRPGADTTINNSVDDWIINVRDTHVELFYHAATSEWKFEESPGGGCSPLLGAFLSCGGREFIGQRIPTECPDGAVVPSVFPNPPEGVYRYESSTQKCYREFYDNVAVFSDGQGGLIRVQNAPRCNRSGISLEPQVRNAIYVDPSIGDDSLSNSGFNSDKPFRTIERAILQGVRESRRSGAFNDRYDRLLIELAPGDYYVDNFPGAGSTPGLTATTGLVQRADTGYQVETSVVGDRSVVITVNSLNPTPTQPPLAFNLGRVLYSESGGVANIAKISKETLGSSIWEITLEYISGEFNAGDALYYDNLSLINPIGGGIIVPRGMSIVGVDLRKVRVRPMYVPELTPLEEEPQRDLTSIFKVTGGTIIEKMTFTDNPQVQRSHNTVTAVTFASQAEINGSGTETSYYSKINSLFSQYDQWGEQGVEPIPAETTIVAPIYNSKDLRQTDAEENFTGAPFADSRVDSPIAYPGAARLRDSESNSEVLFDLPDINSVRSSSPYIKDCSVRSIFGLNGLWADGALVGGFKSMVTAAYTQVSLQTDPTCYLPQTYYLDPPINKTEGGGKQYKVSPVDPFKYRHFGIRGSNDATIQIVSVFAIGNSDHFVAESGADLSITNSCSDFGDISLRSIGYKNRSFSQDEGIPAPGYSGTKITQIIPPLPLSYNALPGRGPTIVDTEINTGLVLDYELTRDAYVDVATPGNLPSSIRIYFRSSNSSSPFTEVTNPPSASRIGFGQFSYTTKLNNGDYELVGGNRDNRKQIRIKGFDELSNSIIYTGDIQLISNPLTSPGFDSLDDRSKIFVWDATAECWYVNVSTLLVAEETTDLDGDGFIQKKLDYAFRYKIVASPVGSGVFFKNLDFLFDKSSLTMIRGIDRRKNEERIYKVVLDGFDRTLGLRRPQNFYVMEKQIGVSGYPLNSGGVLQSEPLTIAQVRTYNEVFPSEITPYPNRYVAYLTTSSQSRKVPTGELYPAINNDEPELTEDPADSITRDSLVEMLNRPGVWFSAPVAPSATPIEIRVSSGAAPDSGILIGLRRPSIIRASGHTWEWTGYLNYDTAFPTFQGEPLEQEYALGKILVEERGGKVYATGMNEEGSFYIGTTVFDLRTGEQFAIPLEADNEPGSVTNQIFNSVVIRSLLAMDDGSQMFFGTDTALFFDPTTTLNTTTGPITASQNPLPEVYATTSKAGFVQLADESVIRGALGSGSQGIAERVVVTAASLARELNLRLENTVGAGVGITVVPTSIELPGGDPTDLNDNIIRYIISVGLPGNPDNVAFGGLSLGGTVVDDGAHLVTSIVNVIDNDGLPLDRGERLVTEEALFTPGWIRGAQVEDNAVTLTKLQQISNNRVLGNLSGATANVSEVEVKNSITGNSSISLVTEAAVVGKFVTIDTTQTVSGLKTFTQELRCTQDIVAFFSDMRLKTDVETITNAVEKVKSLSGFTYRPNEAAGLLGYDESIRTAGVSAQEVQKVLPEAIRPAPANPEYMAVQYEKLIPLLIEAVKEQADQIKALQEAISHAS